MDQLLPNLRGHVAIALVLAVGTLGVILLPGAGDDGSGTGSSEIQTPVAFVAADAGGAAVLGVVRRAD